jgi:type III pantothenate kinase
MRLVIDIGNTRIKPAQEFAGQLNLSPAIPWRDRSLQDVLHAVCAGIPRPTAVLVSNVAGPALAEALAAQVAQHWQLAVEFMQVRPRWAGMQTIYDNPNRLGVDRWLAALAGFHLAGGAVCVIDAGTALTVDIVTADGTHRGGLIAPGLALMARSLTQGTAQLSLDTLTAVDQFATNTRDGISLGCRDAVAGLLTRVAERCARDYGGAPRFIVTGGEAEDILSLSPFALECVPDLVHQGIVLAADAVG